MISDEGKTSKTDGILANDSNDNDLLQGLIQVQSEYVVNTLYPTLKEAIKLYLIEAQRNGHFQEFLSKQGLCSKSSEHDDPFKGYAFKTSQPTQRVDMSSKRSTFGATRFRSGSLPIDQNVQSFQSNFEPLECFKDILNELSKHKLQSNEDSNKFKTPVKPSESYLQSKRRSVFSRPYQTVLEMEEFNPPVYQKTQDQLEKLTNVLKNSFLTKNLTQFELKIIADAMFLKQFKRNELIIKYGDLGHEYFILDQGQIEVIVYKEGTDPNDPEIRKKIQNSRFIPPGVGFGEIALLYNDKRTASIRAAVDCNVWVLEGKVFKNIIIKSTIKRRNIELSFLDKVDLFAKLERYEKLKLIDGLEPKKYYQTDFIFEEGEDGDYFYIIEDGEVECLKNSQCEPLEYINVRNLKSGEHFGELALINNQKRSLSVRVISVECKVLRLNTDAFNRILGDINIQLRKNYDGEFDRKFSQLTPYILSRNTISTVIEDIEHEDQFKNMGDIEESLIR
ncbi:camp-dependent protein kinase regulatory subunit [Stylonychia lemnae]|uniref:Camp-dependent protein kinase regulatory subunit n=1 Tax=Stylonychia lemnae TaxID=5949 RepID=A0A078ADB1_STYLE|nr:camp-dependent protein kinase regulatory subunit [Stylonychia lemnae]|eukprot:CDW80229.1 camp-dependent protein kinase regulatory subunit [Stylonychia lemnae]